MRQRHVSIRKMKLDEDQLVAACLKNDQNAYRQLYERFAPSMLGLCMRYVKDRDAAQDVLHDGFIKVFEKLNTLHANQSLGSWIYTIMLNTARNSIRTPLPVGLIEDTDPNMVQGSVPANALMQFDTEQIVLAMSRLRDSQRLFFNLRGAGTAVSDEGGHHPQHRLPGTQLAHRHIDITTE